MHSLSAGRGLLNVTIPRRTDISTDENFAAHRPTVLAELPHVGEPMTTSAPPAERDPNPQSARTPKSSHPAFAESYAQDEHESMHPPRGNARGQIRFVDQAHIDHEWEGQETVAEVEEERHAPHPRSVNRKVQRHPQSTARQNGPSHHRGWRGWLSEAHAQVAPFAGLIVTAALLACGGLLFLMMAGNQNASDGFDDFAVPSSRVNIENDFEQSDSEIADNFVDSENLEIAPEALQEMPAPLTEQQARPASSSSADTNTVIAAPVIEEIIEPTPPLGSITFPTTTTPLALDYSKALPQPGDELQAFPAVEVGSLPMTEPMNR
jgi:hypothetical protein